MRRWFWAFGILAAVGFLGLLRYNYPEIQTSAGAKYRVTFQGHYRGTDGAWTEVDYLTHSNSIDKTLGEIQQIFPLAEELAKQQGDTLVRVKAITRRFEFGLFHFDRFTVVQFHRVQGGWQTF